MFVGHRAVTYYGTTKNIICIVIRGTNGTLDEWQSNFDVGTTANFSSTSGWTNSANHMGFDITANRLNSKLSSYMSANGLTSSNSILWITGHSRGAALTNLLAAKRVDAGYEVFAYSFATPATTTVSTATATAAKYQCIFNIINNDDLVPQLPLGAWRFTRYGEDKPGSIETTTGYANQWDTLMGGSVSYTSSTTSMGYVIDDFETIADGRNDCYTYRTGDDGYYYMTFDSVDVRDAQWSIQVLMYPDNVDDLYNVQFGSTAIPPTYNCKIYHKPAFFMQLIAGVMGNEITEIEFGLIGIAHYMSEAKAQLTAFSKSGGMEHPHYPISYYLLATKIS